MHLYCNFALDLGSDMCRIGGRLSKSGALAFDGAILEIPPLLSLGILTACPCDPDQGTLSWWVV